VRGFEPPASTSRT